MNLKLKSLPITIFLTLFPFAVAHGRWVTSNNQIPINPNSGLTPNPIFIYDRDSGVISVETAGGNGVVDSMDTNHLEGDDFGFVSLLLSFSGTTDELWLELPNLTDSIAWVRPVIFNDKIQLFGVAIGSQFPFIRESPMPLIRVDPGLTEVDFLGPNGVIEIETGMNYAVGQPGITLFSDGDPLATGAFRIVPEPDSSLIFGLATVVLFGVRRRKVA